MTLNKDLFGNFIPEKPAAVPVSVRKSNKVRVFHTSHSDVPPHMLEPERQEFTSEDNIHPDVLHMGTANAASEFYRANVHEYEIDLAHPNVSSVVWGDSPKIIQQDEEAEETKKRYSAADLAQGVYQPRVDRFNRAMRGKKEGLFENTPADVSQASKTGMVLPYRNRREDAGSVSYVVPKAAVGNGVTYIGRTGGKDFRESLTEGR